MMESGRSTAISVSRSRAGAGLIAGILPGATSMTSDNNMLEAAHADRRRRHHPAGQSRAFGARERVDFRRPQGGARRAQRLRQDDAAAPDSGKRRNRDRGGPV